MQRPSLIAKPRRQTAVNSKLERKLWMYAAAASAAGVSILAATPAEAKVVVTQTNTTISPSVGLDLNHDGIVDFNLIKFRSGRSIETTSFLDVCHSAYQVQSHQCLSSTINDSFENVVRGTSAGAQDLPFGALIGPGQQFGGAKGRVVMGVRDVIASASFYQQTWDGPWVAGGAGVKNRYLGFKFKVGNQFHYGWARVTVTTTANQGFSAVLTGYAYETIPGKAIRAGATADAAEAAEAALGTAPVSTKFQESNREASLGMLSLGSTGLAIWRREDS